MTDTPPAAEPEPPEGDENAVIKELRARAKSADEAEARAAAAERNLAFAEAGIPKDGMGSYFRDAYKGDLDPDAIKAEAVNAGLLGATVDPAVTAAEAQDASAVSAAMAAGDPPAPSGDLAERAREIGRDGYGNVHELDALLEQTAPGEAELQAIFGANSR